MLYVCWVYFNIDIPEIIDEYKFSRVWWMIGQIGKDLLNILYIQSFIVV